MPNKCKIEFYFKSEDLLKLINANPTAKGVIVSQEIVPRQGPDGKFSSIVYIRAKTSNPRVTTVESTATAKMASADSGEEIDGCPYPPGCTE